jgi:hypothetical protein
MHVGPSLDYLVSAGQQRRWDADPQRLRGFQVYDQLELRRLLDGEVAGVSLISR